MGTATAVREPQRAFIETEVNDEGLEKIVTEHEEAKAGAKDPARRFRKAKKALKEAFAERGLTERALKERIRVGIFIITGTAIEGGPTDIPEWKSVRLKVDKRLV